MPAGEQKSKKKVYLTRPPPEDDGSRNCGILFQTFRDATGLTYDDLTSALNVAWAESGRGNAELSIETVKRWKDGAVPKLKGHFEEFILASSKTSEIAEAWWFAFTTAWSRQALLIESVKALQKQVLADRQLNQLPALFETDVTLPLATAYVDLRITPARPIVPMPELLEQRLTLAERIQRRTEQRIRARRPPQAALDTAGAACRLILGAPGSGKSSLLRRLALDIAADKWKTAAVPLFIEARAFAQERRRKPGISLIDYACCKLTGTSLRPQDVRQLLTRSDIPPECRAILLVDGLDEIASDADAVAAIYGELRDSSNGVGWILTARPAGLVQAVGETHRYEMSELDTDSISTLVDNWCRANIEQGMPLDAEALKEELHRVPSIREMSTNPFLLTALCFLKSTARNERLPASRIAVYEKLIERIAHQARARHGNDQSILSADAVRDLSLFARHLYEGERGARQVFTQAMWAEFLSHATPRPNTDFMRQIVPARLLTIWHESDPQYHFLHLTLHEYFVAVAMLEWTVDDALDRRFKPAWRTVFRFYGALLWQRGLKKQFAHLTIGLYQSSDINNLSLITLAEIFADAGLSDTKAQLGEDLREVIWSAITKTGDHAVGAEAFVDALALLDSNWLASKTQDNELYLLDISRSSITELATREDYHGHQEVLSGQTFSGPFLRYARARTSAAAVRIEEAFYSDDQGIALLAATAHAEIATPAQRDGVVTLGEHAKMFKDDAVRTYAFALHNRSHAFLPFLARLTDHFAKSGDHPFAEALSLVADIGGEDAQTILEARLLAEIPRRASEDEHQIEICARAVARLGGEPAIEILEKAIKATNGDKWTRYLEITRDSISPDGDRRIVAALRRFDTASTAIRTIADNASFGRFPGALVMTAVRKLAAHASASDGFDLAILERHRLDAGESLNLGKPLQTIAANMLAQLRDADEGSEARRGIILTLPVILDALGRGRWKPSRRLFEEIIDDQTLPFEILEAAIAAAGYLLEATSDSGMLARLETILYDDDYAIDAYEVTLAIGRIDIEALYHKRGALTAASTLQQIAAERDVLVFEDRWVDRDGTIRRWSIQPRKVLYAASERREKIVEVVSHELSRFNLVMGKDWHPDDSVGLVVIEPLQPKDRTFGDAGLLLLEREGGRVYGIPAKANVGAARKLARDIGADIDSRLRRQSTPRRAP